MDDRIPKYKVSDKGFTILEVLVAVVIFAVGLLAVASMQSNAITSNSFAQRHSVATAVAQGALENIMALPEADPVFDVVVNDAVHDLDPGTAVSTVTINGGIYTATRDVNPNTPVAGVTTIQILINGPGTPIGGITVTGFKRAT